VKNLWPNGWRVASKGLGGYLIQQSPILICSGILGVGATASLGLANQLVNIISQVASIWVQVKIPEFHRKLTRGLMKEVRSLFFQRLCLGVLTLFTGVIVLVFLGERFLDFIGSDTPLPGQAVLAALGGVAILELIKRFLADLVIAKNVNPFWFIWPLSGVIVAFLCYTITLDLGMMGIPMGIFTTGLLTTYPHVIYYSFRELIGKTSLR